MSLSKIIKIQEEIGSITNNTTEDFSSIIGKLNSKLNGIYAYYAVETNENNIEDIYKYAHRKAFELYCKHKISEEVAMTNKWSDFCFNYDIAEPICNIVL